MCFAKSKKTALSSSPLPTSLTYRYLKMRLRQNEGKLHQWCNSNLHCTMAISQKREGCFECNTSLITSSETSLHVIIISADKSCCFPSNTYHLNEAEWFNYTPLLPSWPQGTFFTCSFLSPDPES